MGFLSSLGSAALGMVDTVTNNYFNKKAASKQNAYQWDFWHANNDYNSPKSQMQRLEEAGLNPNLVYGNGGVTHQATMSTAPKVTPAQSNLLGSLAIARDLLSLEQMKAQTNSIETQVERQEAEIPAIKAAAARREEIIRRTGVDPEGSGPVSWAAGPALWIADKYHALEKGIGRGLNYLFGSR